MSFLSNTIWFESRDQKNNLFFTSFIIRAQIIIHLRIWVKKHFKKRDAVFWTELCLSTLTPPPSPPWLLPLLRPSTGVLRQSHRHLDGRVSAVRVLRPAGVRRRQLHRPATQRAAALQTEATAREGEHLRHAHRWLKKPQMVFFYGMAVEIVFVFSSW